MLNHHLFLSQVILIPHQKRTPTSMNPALPILPSCSVDLPGVLFHKTENGDVTWLFFCPQTTHFPFSFQFSPDRVFFPFL